MESLAGFIIENGIGYSPDIFLAAGIFAYFIGGFLKKKNIGDFKRTLIYCSVGVIFGVMGYSNNAIGNRSLEVLEAVTLGIGMFVIALIVIYPITCIFLPSMKKSSEEQK